MPYVGLVGILYQMRDHRKVVITHASRTLRPAESHAKSSTFLELLAVKWLLTEPIRHFLLSVKVHIYRNSRNLLYWQNIKVGRCGTEMVGPVVHV